jgi:rhodanese-related sulfurtransferase
MRCVEIDNSKSTSARAALQLKKAGWTKAKALVGGWQAWKDAGLPTEKR